jgi:hypothetical protein
MEPTDDKYRQGEVVNKEITRVKRSLYENKKLFTFFDLDAVDTFRNNHTCLTKDLIKST